MSNIMRNLVVRKGKKHTRTAIDSTSPLNV